MKTSTPVALRGLNTLLMRVSLGPPGVLALMPWGKNCREEGRKEWAVNGWRTNELKGYRGRTGSRSMRPLAQVRFMVRGRPLRQMAVRLLSGRRAAGDGKGSCVGFCMCCLASSGGTLPSAAAPDTTRRRSMAVPMTIIR